MQAILFDLDGTLIDTLELILESFRRACIDVLGYTIPDEKVTSLIGIPLIEQTAILAPDKSEELLEAYQRHQFALHDELIGYFEGTREMLDVLKGENRLLGVVTSKRTVPANRGLAHFDLQGYFALVNGMEASTYHKPRPEPLIEAARDLGVSIEGCVYIGDSVFDVQAANSAGAISIAVLWGTGSRPQLIDAGAAYLVSTPGEIPALIHSIEASDGGDLKYRPPTLEMVSSRHG
jgi:pyrophosphatase PpaX